MATSPDDWSDCPASVILHASLDSLPSMVLRMHAAPSRQTWEGDSPALVCTLFTSFSSLFQSFDVPYRSWKSGRQHCGYSCGRLRGSILSSRNHLRDHPTGACDCSEVAMLQGYGFPLRVRNGADADFGSTNLLEDDIFAGDGTRTPRASDFEDEGASAPAEYSDGWDLVSLPHSTTDQVSPTLNSDAHADYDELIYESEPGTLPQTDLVDIRQDLEASLENVTTRHLPTGGLARLDAPHQEAQYSRLQARLESLASEQQSTEHMSLEDKRKQTLHQSPEFTDKVLLKYSNEFEPVREDGWDTVLYIGPPARQYNESDDGYRITQERFSRPYLMKSETLKATGSAEFVKRLGPMSARASRKLKNLGLHQNLPDSGTPKYWIDLRPMQNDEEALLMVAELTCTPGILSWHRLAKSRRIDTGLVDGKDDINTSHSTFLDIIESHESGFPHRRKSGADTLQDDLNPQVLDQLEPEYSPIRHHVALERVLHAIAGNSPRLNSAAKMWNFFVIAKFLDCATFSRVCDPIHSWLFAGFNSDFIETNPEVAYRIALGTQSRLLLKVAFSILVGEKALQQAMQSPMFGDPVPPSHNLSRPHCHLDDDETNRIDYAAQSLQRRVLFSTNAIFNKPTTWMCKSPEFIKLLALDGRSAASHAQLTSFLHTVYKHVGLELVQSLSQNLVVWFSSDRIPITDPVTNVHTRGFHCRQVERYNALPLPQRVFSQIAWYVIKGIGLTNGNIGHTEFKRSQRAGASYFGLDAQDQQIDPLLRFKWNADLGALNRLILRQEVSIRSGPGRDNEDPKAPSAHTSTWQDLYKAAATNPFLLSSELAEEERLALQATFEAAGIMYDHEHNMVIRGVQDNANSRRVAFVGDGGRIPTGSTCTSHEINGPAMLKEFTEALSDRIIQDVLNVGYISDETGIEADIPNKGIDTLLCLGDEEFKYLPLWADGCDDGSGGVFADVVPGTQEEEFSGGRRGLDMSEGLDGLGEIEMGEEGFSVVGREEVESTVARASKMATDGTGTASIMSMEE